MTQYQLGGYQISEQDVNSPGTSYYLNVAKNSEWYIMKAVAATTKTTYTYARGNTAPATAWTNKGALTYYTFENLYANIAQ